jgi:hypothetical protein
MNAQHIRIGFWQFHQSFVAVNADKIRVSAQIIAWL